MTQGRLLSTPRTPAVVAKWLLIAFATGQLGLNLWHADAPDVILLSLPLVLWIVGPAALAMLLAVRARSQAEAWMFVAAEVAAIASTVALWVMLIFIKTGHANAEYAVGLFLLPVIQFAALLVYALVVITTFDLALPKNRQDGKPRILLLTMLSLASVVLAIVLAWMFGYIRA